MKLIPGVKYDPNYKKETNAVTAGIILLILPALFYLFVPYEKKEISIGNMSILAKIALVLVDFLLRALVTGWVKTIAIKQNRDKSIWGLFAFFFPSVVLIIIGLTSKIDRTDEVDSPATQASRKKLRNNMTGLFFVVLLTITALIICFVKLYPRR
jgi:hypothetical protein